MGHRSDHILFPVLLTFWFSIMEMPPLRVAECRPCRRSVLRAP